MKPARRVLSGAKEVHIIHGADKVWHQLDRLCACEPTIYVLGGVHALWVRMEHLHYGPEQEFDSEEPSA